jgi:hypothetical protein
MSSTIGSGQHGALVWGFRMRGHTDRHESGPLATGANDAGAGTTAPEKDR